MSSNLNDKQRLAIDTTEWPVLIVAWAWSWKTKTLTHRIANILSKWVKPWEIIAVTFTNKAWDEMKNRIKSLLEKEKWYSLSDSEMPFIWTFHSFCLRILRAEISNIWFTSDFIIYDTQDQESAMKQVMEKLAIDEKTMRPKTLLSMISSYKNQFIWIDDFWYDSSLDMNERIFNVYKEYQDLLKKNNAVDFDDILFFTLKIFSEFSEILNKYSNRYKYISVDEYQDTNHVQYLLIKALWKNHGNVCAIWDADQSIYSFRWANIRNILEFEKDFKWCQIIKLEQNYRSTQVILDAANDVISNNSWRHPKKMWSNIWEWEKIKIVQTASEKSEWDFIVSEIKKQMKENPLTNLSNFAIFYRTNAQSRAIEESMMKEWIIYKIIWWIKFYARKEIKDILAYLRFIYNPKDSVSMLRIINVPARKIWDTTIAKLQNFAWQRSLSVWEILNHIDVIEWLSAWAKKSVKDFALLIRNLQKLQKSNSLSEFIDIVLNESWYLEIFKDDKSPESKSRIENLMELKSVASKFDQLWEDWLKAFLDEVALVADTDAIDDSNAVLLMTIHSAKWLEFENVFVVWMEEGIFPSNQSIEDDSWVEEERRLAYVAITRARKNLYLLYARSRLLYWKFQNNLISRFLHEIPKNLTEEIKFSYWWAWYNNRSNWVNTPSWMNF